MQILQELLAVETVIPDKVDGGQRYDRADYCRGNLEMQTTKELHARAFKSATGT
jgi:hypothetical protein